jgi:hypothetical protein
MDIRVAEENRQKYLEMLTTKIFLNEKEILGLTHGSCKNVDTVCPFCGKHKIQRYKRIITAGHTLCTNCSKTIRAHVDILGSKKGRLFFYDFAPYRQSGKQKCGMVKAICDCGSEGEYFINTVKSRENQSCGCMAVEKSKARVGELSPTWKPSLTDEERLKRRSGIGSWARAVKIRDNFTCQVCGSNVNLVAHHLNCYKDNKDKRVEIENGVTMCRDCHIDFHINFMGNYRVPCTSEDFEEYLLQV